MFYPKFKGTITDITGISTLKNVLVQLWNLHHPGTKSFELFGGVHEVPTDSFCMMGEHGEELWVVFGHWIHWILLLLNPTFGSMTYTRILNVLKRLLPRQVRYFHHFQSYGEGSCPWFEVYFASVLS